MSYMYHNLVSRFKTFFYILNRPQLRLLTPPAMRKRSEIVVVEILFLIYSNKILWAIKKMFLIEKIR